MQISPADFHATADGHRPRCRWFTDKARPGQPVVVMLHQGLGSVSQWRDFPQKLGRATGCAVLAYDRHGYGGSDPLNGPRTADFLDLEATRALPQLLSALGIERPILYGHSDGATIALMHAAAFPDGPLAVIDEAGHVFSEVHTATGFSDVVMAFETGDLRAKLERHHGANTASMFQAWADIWRSPEMRDWQMLDRLACIRCPVLVVQGRDDTHGGASQIDPMVERSRGPVETFWVADCGHAPHLETPDVVVERVAAFLAPIVARALDDA